MTLKHVASGGAQRLRAVNDTHFNLTGPRFKPKTFLSNSDVFKDVRDSISAEICTLIPVPAETGKIPAKLPEIITLVCSTAFLLFLSYSELIFSLLQSWIAHHNNIAVDFMICCTCDVRHAGVIVLK